MASDARAETLSDLKHLQIDRLGQLLQPFTFSMTAPSALRGKNGLTDLESREKYYARARKLFEAAFDTYWGKRPIPLTQDDWRDTYWAVDHHFDGKSYDLIAQHHNAKSKERLTAKMVRSGVRRGMRFLGVRKRPSKKASRETAH